MTSAGREILKWVALVLMTGDHVNKALLHGAYPWMTDVARVVFPIFAVVFAFNMMRAEAVKPALLRLAIAGVIAQPFHALAFGYWVPFNVLLTFAAALVVIDSLQTGRHVLAAAVFAVAGLFVDFSWPGLALFVSSWWFFKNHGGRQAYWLLGSYDWRRGRLYAMFPVWVWASLVWLCWYNGNAWALFALPLLAVLGSMPGNFPRWRWTFLAYYVAHFAVICLLARV